MVFPSFLTPETKKVYICSSNINLTILLVNYVCGCVIYISIIFWNVTFINWTRANLFFRETFFCLQWNISFLEDAIFFTWKQLFFGTFTNSVDGHLVSSKSYTQREKCLFGKFHCQIIQAISSWIVYEV